MDKKRITIFIVAAILLILSIIGVEILYTRTYKLENELTALNQNVRDLEAQEKRILAVRQSATESGVDASSLDQYFVDDTGALDFLKYIEGLAASSGLTSKTDVFDAQQDPVLSEQGKEYLKMAIRTTGSMNNIRLFLSLIESLPYNVKISRVDIRKNGDGPKDWSALVDFSVVKSKEVTP